MLNLDNECKNFTLNESSSTLLLSHDRRQRMLQQQQQRPRDLQLHVCLCIRACACLCVCVSLFACVADRELAAVFGKSSLKMPEPVKAVFSLSYSSLTSLSHVPLLSRSSISFTTSSARCSLSQCPHLSRRIRALVVVPPLPQLLPLPLSLPLPLLQLPLPLLLRLLPVALCLCKISAIAFLGLFVLSPLSSSPSAALFWQLVHPFGAELCN